MSLRNGLILSQKAFSPSSQNGVFNVPQARFGPKAPMNMISHQRPVHNTGNKLTQRLRENMDNRRKNKRYIEPEDPQKIAQMVDFGSNDTLSLGSSETLRTAFLAELAKHPNFEVGSRSTRIFEGSSQYLLDLEKHMAHFHSAESALFFPSGYEANVAIWSTVPQPGDVVIYDELIHASIHDGMRDGRAMTRMFSHNSCESLRETLLEICRTVPSVKTGEQTVFIALESFYSMDGDMAPVREMVELVKDILPSGDVVFSIDEAHSNGLIGENGSGYICKYGLEKEFALRLHTCGKGLGSTGAAVLANPTIRSYLINYARGLIFTTAPAFPILAAVRAGYTILASKEGEERRNRLNRNIRHFYQTLTNDSEWEKCLFSGIISLPTWKTWDAESFHAPIIPLVTEVGEAGTLARHLEEAGFHVNPVVYPIVPRDKERVRLVIHADNTVAQIEEVVEVIMAWFRKCLKNRADSTRLACEDGTDQVAASD